jgi:hypothetical protein
MRKKSADATEALDLDAALSAFRWSVDGCSHMLGEWHFANETDARAGWRQVRRAAWAREHRFALPAAAGEYDVLTREGWALLWRTWQNAAFSLADILAALERDRASVAAFERADRTGAAAVADFLRLWRDDMDAIEREARRFAGLGAGRWRSGCPAITSASRYGAGASSSLRVRDF